MTRDQRGRHHHRDAGFTLVELLVVIVILGILATVTVFAVRSITDKGATNACATDSQTMSKAEEAYYAIEGVYGSEAEMMAAQVLKTESGLHDVTLGTDSYTIVATGTCAGGSSASAATTTTSSTPALPSGVTATTYAGFPAQSIGSGSLRIVLFGTGDGRPLALSEWQVVLASTVPVPPTMTVTWVDTTSMPLPVSATVLNALLTGPADYLIVAAGTANATDGTSTASVYDFVGLFQPTPVCRIGVPANPTADTCSANLTVG